MFTVMDHSVTSALRIFLISCFMYLISCTRVKISSPVGTPKEGGILSVYCQVWDLNPGQEVTISRDLSNGDGERLSWNDDVLPSVDERVFLATRRQDGALVYFLTIMDVVKNDQGSYSCKIVLQSELKVIAEDSMDMDVHYFPEDLYPKCSSGPLHIVAGTKVVFKCTSVDAIPTIDLKWTGTNSRKSENLQGTMIKRHEMIMSTLEITPSIQDDGIVFVCTLKSSAFLEKSRSCHIGPLFVTLSSYDASRDSSRDTTESNSKHLSVTKTRHIVDGINVNMNVSTHVVHSSVSCASVCRRHASSRVGFWVITTWVTCVTVVVLVIFCVIISLKMYCLSRADIAKDCALRSQTAAAQDVYERLECRAQNASLYMTLEKPGRRTHRQDATTEITYTLAPTAPDID